MLCCSSNKQQQATRQQSAVTGTVQSCSWSFTNCNTMQFICMHRANVLLYYEVVVVLHLRSLTHSYCSHCALARGKAKLKFRRNPLSPSCSPALIHAARLRALFFFWFLAYSGLVYAAGSKKKRKTKKKKTLNTRGCSFGVPLNTRVCSFGYQ